MGMGLLGAMGGLGQAGQQIGNTMMQHALKEEELSWIEQRQTRMAEMAEARKKATIDTERKETGLLYDKATSGAGIAEGPPTEDGAMPKGPMSDKEKMSAYSDALGKAGRHAEKMQVDTLMQRDEATTAMRELKDRLNQRTNDTRLTTTGMRVDGQLAGKSADIAARLAKLNGGAGRSRSSSGGDGSGGGYDKFFNEFFKADEKAGLPSNDMDGFGVFKRYMANATSQNPGVNADNLAANAIRQISNAREMATGPNGLDVKKYRQLLDALGREKNQTTPDDPTISDASTIDAGRRDAEQAEPLPKKSSGLLGLSSGSRPTEDIYAGAGPDNARLGALPGVPFAQLLDILRGKKNHEALGRQFESSEDSLLDWISRGEKQ